MREESHEESTMALDLTIKDLGILAIAFVLMMSSSVFVHETGNRFLSMGTFFGIPGHIRAISCFFNIAGVASGFALAAFGSNRFLKLRKSMPFWAGFFILQGLFCGIFYGTLIPGGEGGATCVTQFFIGASEAVFFTVCMEMTRCCSFHEFKTSAIASMLGCVVVTYGILSALCSVVHMLVVASIHFVIIAIAAACFLYIMFINQRTASIFGADPNPSIDLSASSSDEYRVHPIIMVLVALCVYGAVFGFLHVIPLGLPTLQLPRVIPNLIGAAIAAALFYASLPRSKADPTTVLIWNRVYRLVFPFVTLAALLIPFTGGNSFISSLAFVESAQFFFIMLLASACWTICRTTGVSSHQVFAYAFFVYNLGFLVGDAVAAVVHDTAPLDNQTFSIIGIAVFLLLMVVTFNVNAEKYAKTAWGIIPKESPKALYRRNMSTRCEQLADENHLTAREREVLLLLAEGKRPKEISEELVVSVATVRTHVQGVYSKLDVHSYDDLFKLLRKND